MPKAEFHGILAVGRSKTDAINKYRLLAMGKGAVAQVSGDRKTTFVTHASHAEQMFNPLTGDMDLETDNQILDSLEFASNSSADIEANHLVCSSGCGAHVVFDSESLVKYCPQCTSALSESSDDEDEDEEDETDDLGDASGDSEDDDAEDTSESEGCDDDSEEDTSESDDDSDEESDEDNEEDEDEDDEEDSSVVVSSSFEEALKVFSSHKQMSSMSSGEKVKAQYVVCSSGECGAHILSDNVVAECPVCLSEVAEPEGDVTGEIDLSKVAETEAATSESDDLGDGEVPGDDIGEESDEEGSEDEGEAEESEEGSEEEAAEPAAEEEPAAESGDDESEEGSEEAAEEAPAEEDAGDSNALTVLDDDEDSELGEDTEEIAADSDMDESASADDLDVSYSSAVAGQAAWTAYHKGTPIAMARKSTSGKNADIFDTPSFGHAALATAKVAGVKKALAELGFTPIKHKVSVSKEVRRLVDSQVAEQREALASEVKGYKEKFMAALATSAIGINRGFFAGITNPLKSALWNAMSSAGVRNPEVVIDNAFKAHSDAYHTVLFAQASDIAAKPAEVQESLAKTILGTNYQAVSSEQPEGSIENRLASMGTSVSTEQKPGANTEAVVKADPGMQQIHRAVSSLGRRAR